MRRPLCSLVIAVLFVLCAEAARAESYFSVYGGLVQPHDSKVKNNVSGETGKIFFRDSASVGFKTGYWFSSQGAPYFGLQFDANGYHSHIKELVDDNGTVAPVTSNTDFAAVTLNAVLRADVEGLIRPYAGMGAGWFYMNIGAGTKPVTAVGINPNGWTGGSESTYGFQGFVGVDVPVTESLALFAEYKFLMAKFSFSEKIYFPLDVDYQSSQLYGGVTYTF